MKLSLVLAVVFTGACADLDSVTSAPEAETAPPAGRLAGRPLYVEPTNYALSTAAAWRPTRPQDAALLERIGKTPQAVWFNGWHTDVAAATSQYTAAAASAGAVPVLVAYNVPQRDCGSYSAGGTTSMDAYLSWVRAFGAGIADRSAIVVLEPDALAGMGCLSDADRNRRISMLAEAVRILKQNPNTFVYLDAGHARWIDAAEMARRLIAANVAGADGFALNVSNFVWTSENVRYGEAISAIVGGKHFIIDTSRNGQGSTNANEWCNPDGRGLGASPSTSTGHPLVDALLWVKRPGESDGACNGGPAAGKWWPDYALGLAQRATTQLALY